MGLLDKLFPPREPGPLTETEAHDDPLMGDPLAAGPESFEADPEDKDGLGDRPEDVDPSGLY